MSWSCVRPENFKYNSVLKHELWDVLSLKKTPSFENGICLWIKYLGTQTLWIVHNGNLNSHFRSCDNKDLVSVSVFRPSLLSSGLHANGRARKLICLERLPTHNRHAFYRFLSCFILQFSQTHSFGFFWIRLKLLYMDCALTIVDQFFNTKNYLRDVL